MIGYVGRGGALVELTFRLYQSTGGSWVRNPL